MWAKINYFLLSIRATDNTLKQTTINNLNKVQICNCNTVDKNATCLSTVQTSYNPNVEFLNCQCSSPYSGSFCENLKDFCLTKNCNSTQTCNNLPPELQTSTQAYVCCETGLVFNNVTGVCSAGKLL